MNKTKCRVMGHGLQANSDTWQKYIKDAQLR